MATFNSAQLPKLSPALHVYVTEDGNAGRTYNRPRHTFEQPSRNHVSSRAVDQDVGLRLLTIDKMLSNPRPDLRPFVDSATSGT